MSHNRKLQRSINHLRFQINSPAKSKIAISPSNGREMDHGDENSPDMTRCTIRFKIRTCQIWKQTKMFVMCDETNLFFVVTRLADEFVRGMLFARWGNGARHRRPHLASSASHKNTSPGFAWLKHLNCGSFCDWKFGRPLNFSIWFLNRLKLVITMESTAWQHCIETELSNAINPSSSAPTIFAIPWGWTNVLNQFENSRKWLNCCFSKNNVFRNFRIHSSESRSEFGFQKC